MTELQFENPALFYGAHANYARMGGFVGAIVEHGIPVQLVDTGQHWDPDFIGTGFGENVQAVNLGTRTSDSAVISQAAKSYLDEAGHDGVFVYGDTASALGPALAANELGLPLVHLEAGFRTYDRDGKRMSSPLPEEDIRNKIDRMADVVVPLLPSARRALIDEKTRGLVRGSITEATGHPLADPVLANRPMYGAVQPDEGLGLFTIHRKANLTGESRSGLADALGQVGGMRHIDWLFPVYPATGKLIEAAGLHVPSNVYPVSPLDHAAMIDKIAYASIAVSDSAGLQVEIGLAPRPLVVPRMEAEYPDLLCESVVMAQPSDIASAVQLVRSVPAPTAERLASIDEAFGNGAASVNLFRFIASLTVTKDPAGQQEYSL